MDSAGALAWILMIGGTVVLALIVILGVLSISLIFEAREYFQRENRRHRNASVVRDPD